MSPERLIQHFERISEAPDAIPRLRNFILDLAVRGKLVEQEPNDKPATALLCELREAKDRLQEEENIRGRQPVSRTGSSELGFPVPDTWAFPAFDDVFVIVSGVTKGRNLAGRKTVEVPYLRVANVQRGYLDLSVMKTIYIPEDELPRYALRHGDILMTEGGDWDKLGRAAIWLDEIAQCIHQNHVFRIRSPLPGKLHPRWVVTYTNSLLGRSYFENAAKQTTNLASINMTQLRGCPLPLPSFAEQHRIVAKVDELMALCDQLEAAKTEREQSRDRLVAASLHRLNSPAATAETDAPDLPSRQADAFRDHARFVFKHLPRLTTRPEHIKQLRQTILNLAMRGKLVPQNPSDEPVSSQLALNDHARKEIAQKDRRADSGIQQLLVPEEKWAVPASWEWRGVADLVLFIDYRGKTPSKEEEGIRLITAKNVRKGFISLSPEEFFSESDYRAWMTRGIPQEGDVLFTTEAPMGNAAVVRLEERFALAQRVINFRPYGALDPDFLVLQLLAEPFQSILDKTATGLTAKGIKAAKLKRLPMAIPPLAEQHRIVTRVDELMALCDQLEAQLTATEADSHRLLEAVLHEALNPLAERTEWP